MNTTTSYVSFRVSKHGNAYAEFRAYTESEGDVYLRTEDVDALLLMPVTAEHYSRHLFRRANGSVADITTTRFRVDITFTRQAGGFATVQAAAVHAAPKSTAFAQLGTLQAVEHAPRAAAPAAPAADADLG